MKAARAFTNSIVLALGIASLPHVQAQLPDVTVGLAINQVMGELDGLLGSARDSGDYLTARAAMEAKGVIETWRDANKELLGKAFSELDETQRNIFNNARQLASQANSDAESRLKNAQEIVNHTNQLLASVKADAYVTRFSPRVVPVSNASTVTLKVTGVNLDSAEPTLSLGQNKFARMVIGPMEVHYTVPLKALPREPEKISYIPLSLSYNKVKDGIFNRIFRVRETVTRNLPVITLPNQLGFFKFQATVEEQLKDVKNFESQPHRFEGRNTTKRSVARPPDGWQWDWSQGRDAFRQNNHSGRAGSCRGILANESSKDGITHSARLNERREVRFNPTHIGRNRIVYGPGYQNCSVIGPIYRLVPTSKVEPELTGRLLWNEDVRIPIPLGAKSYVLELGLFDGRKRIITGTAHDKFFDVLPTPTELVIQPRQPSDL